MFRTTLARSWILLAASACGPATLPPAGPEAGSAVDAGPPPAEPDVAASAADAPGPAEPDAAPPPATDDPALEAFHSLLAALAGGSARAVREFVPAGGSLVLLQHICRKPIYGVGTCRDERAEAERRRVDDQVLAPWQQLLARAAAADPAFSPTAAAATCRTAEGETRRCSAEIRFGSDECRGDLRAGVWALLRPEAGGWRASEIGYDEEILLCQ